MMKLSTWSALKSTFCYLKNHYWRLLGLYFIAVLCGFVLVILMGGASFIADKLNLFESLTFSLNTGKFDDMWEALLPQLFTLSAFSVFAWLLVCSIIFAITFLLSALQVSVSKAVILDQKINLNVLRPGNFSESLRLVGATFLTYLAILFIAALFIAAFFSLLILIPKNKVMLAVVFGIILALLLLSLMIYLTARLNLPFTGIAVGDVTSWRGVFNLSKVQNWTVLKVVLVSAATTFFSKALLGLLGMLIDQGTPLGGTVSMSIALFTLPLYAIADLALAFLYKQYKTQQALEHTPTAVQPVQA
jgi:hypothetical protein